MTWLKGYSVCAGAAELPTAGSLKVKNHGVLIPFKPLCEVERKGEVMEYVFLREFDSSVSLRIEKFIYFKSCILW